MIRQARRLRTRDVGAAMGIGQRTYEYLEAGKTQATLERLRLFAAATGSDINGIMAAYGIGSVAFGLRAADNKLVTAFLIRLQEFDQDLGDDVAILDAASCIAAFDEAFQQLTEEVRRRTAARDALRKLNGEWREGDDES